ncbi:FHA domain-containing protein [Zhaonella formicivorans]|uniref:FHA domain-containing protein n=1 Tax=Zhaonella formicivorans TaxID=2528593 RepID=UPI001D10075A|nr:FHA domain-containing protein [Zhaonella formicivorans]
MELILALLRYAFLVLLYLFIFAVFRAVVEDLSRIKLAGRNMSNSYKLVVRESGESSNLQPGDIFPLGDQVVLGRYADSDIAIGDPHISARHAALRQENGFLVLQDLGSTNGTFLNGKRIKGNKRLQPGDLLRLGDVTFEVMGWENESGST